MFHRHRHRCTTHPSQRSSISCIEAVWDSRQPSSSLTDPLQPPLITWFLLPPPLGEIIRQYSASNCFVICESILAISIWSMTTSVHYFAERLLESELLQWGHLNLCFGSVIDVGTYGVEVRHGDRLMATSIGARGAPRSAQFATYVQRQHKRDISRLGLCRNIGRGLPHNIPTVPLSS